MLMRQGLTLSDTVKVIVVSFQRAITKSCPSLLTIDLFNSRLFDVSL